MEFQNNPPLLVMRIKFQKFLLGVLLWWGLTPSIHARMVIYPERYAGFGITGNVQGFHFYSWGMGIGYNSMLINAHSGGICKLEFERTPSVNLNAIKLHVGGYFFDQYLMIYVGIGEVFCFREGTPYVSIRPEIGYGIGFCQLTYGRNIADAKAHQWISRNTFTLGIYIPIKNKRIYPTYF